MTPFIAQQVLTTLKKNANFGVILPVIDATSKVMNITDNYSAMQAANEEQEKREKMLKAMMLLQAMADNKKNVPEVNQEEVMKLSSMDPVLTAHAKKASEQSDTSKSQLIESLLTKKMKLGSSPEEIVKFAAEVSNKSANELKKLDEQLNWKLATRELEFGTAEGSKPLHAENILEEYILRRANLL